MKKYMTYEQIELSNKIAAEKNIARLRIKRDGEVAQALFLRQIKEYREGQGK